MVYFVGAGCGAPDLITVRGARLLQQADVIVYAGSLVNPKLLENAKANCRIYDSAHMTLEEVIDVLRKAEDAHLLSVRLHTGDPSIFGAIREQMDRLRQLNIPFEICPGVSSFEGAAADLQCEYTLPGVSQTLILTRMAGRTPVPERENLKSLAVHRSSMVIFLSAGMAEQVAGQLMEGGYPPQTPAAIACRVGYADEQLIRCRLCDLGKCARDNAIHKTALLIVGECLGDHYDRSRLYDPGFTTGYRKASVVSSETAERPDLSARISEPRDIGGAAGDGRAGNIRAAED